MRCDKLRARVARERAPVTESTMSEAIPLTQCDSQHDQENDIVGQAVSEDGRGEWRCAEDIAHWPYTPGLLVKWVSFLGSLHWPAGDLDLGFGGISYVELLILYDLWAGERLSLEKATPRYLRPGRPISVSAVCSFWSRY